MRHILSVLFIISTIMIFASTVTGEEKNIMHHEVMSKAVWYTCSCDDCGCNTLSDKPGKCTCGRELVPMRILKIDGNKGYFCSCGPDCTCKLDPEDPTKCTCGKPTRIIDLTGKYVCKCCNVISDKPGRCICGKELEALNDGSKHPEGMEMKHMKMKHEH
jgi:hypothetical protein